MSLTACKTIPVEPPRIVYPKALFQCLDAPSAAGITDDSALAIFIADLAAAHQDCKGRLTRVETVVNPQEQ